MPTEPSPSAIELGHHLTRLRELAGITQGELAKRVTMSNASLSRVEAGEREMSHEELQDILKAIATDEASQFQIRTGRTWGIIPKPQLDHEDHDLLWSAEQVACDLAALRNREAISESFGRRLSEYIKQIERSAGLLLKREHQIAFIGHIGVGKSTAICRLTNLELPGDPPTPVLEAGGGGITICEVNLSYGNNCGLIIEPRSEDEIRSDVDDFAEHIYRRNSNKVDMALTSDGGGEGISKEVLRSIRNMAGLQPFSEKSVEGKKPIVRDPARELASATESQKTFVVEVLSRMRLHQRDQRAIWYNSATGKSEKVWLKDTFERINNGRHPEFSLPKRMEMVVNTTLLSIPNLTVKIVDTKGLDTNAPRADLESHFDDLHTLTILCTTFNDAPGQGPRMLLERAIQSGVKSLQQNAAVLVLHKNNEAMAMKDDATGDKVATIEEGYALKADQISLSLDPLGLGHLACTFFDAHKDRAEKLGEFLSHQIIQSRQEFRGQLQMVIADAKMLVVNHAKEQVKAVLEDASEHLHIWVTRHRALPDIPQHVEDSLLIQMAQTHAATIRASVRRGGEWDNLNYAHHLGFGARRMAVLAFDKWVDSFSDHCANLAANPRLADAVDLINQASQVMRTSYDEMLKKVQLMGVTSFRQVLRHDSDFWKECIAQWGQGGGYKDRVVGLSRVWFTAGIRRAIENEIRQLLEDEWRKTLDRVIALFDNGTPDAISSTAGGTA
jgi:transcriptional regulator with XRE-family HTH domain